MIRPLTCLSLVAAMGAGLYLYQEKHRAQLLDRDITRTVKQAEQSRDRIGVLKAEWALLNEPERLAGLAAQHLALQPLQPAQFARLEDLRARLPPISLAPAPPAMDEAPVAAASSAQPARSQVAMAAAQALRPVAASATAAKPSAAPAPVVALPPMQLAAARPTPRPIPVAPKPREEAVAHAPEVPRPIFAPVMPAYAPAPVVVHAPTVQIASAMSVQPAPFVGSALGMGRTVLAAPVPMSPATLLGYASGR